MCEVARMIAGAEVARMTSGGLSVSVVQSAVCHWCENIASDAVTACASWESSSDRGYH
jgi:hypothetical protein